MISPPTRAPDLTGTNTVAAPGAGVVLAQFTPTAPGKWLLRLYASGLVIATGLNDPNGAFLLDADGFSHHFNEQMPFDDVYLFQAVLAAQVVAGNSWTLRNSAAAAALTEYIGRVDAWLIQP